MNDLPESPELPTPPPPEPEPREGLRVGLPWERMEPGMSPAGLLQTIRLVLFTPADAFGMMRVQGSMAAPIVFLLALGTVGTFFGLIWQSWAQGMLASMGGQLPSFVSQSPVGVLSFVLAPLFIALVALIATGVHHLFLMMFGGAPRSPEVTLRVVCYAWGANYVWMIIPVCGNLVATVWAAALTIVGLQWAHGIPRGRAAAAVLVPYVIAGCCLVLLWSAVTASMLATIQ